MENKYLLFLLGFKVKLIDRRNGTNAGKGTRGRT